eukprot:TRINITY_DN2312_c0_g1_i1.p1 TRINITY_DN2312_c0_g1~~TRINITY_DN2312_c0_g1_i1.p1  ORF type:complete len:284 (+),score=33.55 TRINITY_DN2312_c0_g1_i1:22-873(+)
MGDAAYHAALSIQRVFRGHLDRMYVSVLREMTDGFQSDMELSPALQECYLVECREEIERGLVVTAERSEWQALTSHFKSQALCIQRGQPVHLWLMADQYLREAAERDRILHAEGLSRNDIVNLKEADEVSSGMWERWAERIYAASRIQAVERGRRMRRAYPHKLVENEERLVEERLRRLEIRLTEPKKRTEATAPQFSSSLSAAEQVMAAPAPPPEALPDQARTRSPPTRSGRSDLEPVSGPLPPIPSAFRLEDESRRVRGVFAHLFAALQHSGGEYSFDLRY